MCIALSVLVAGVAMAAEGLAPGAPSLPVDAGIPEPLSVVTSVPPLAMLARAVGGSHVIATSLLPPGASPHTFSLGPSAARRLARADLFISMGGGLDPWAERAARALGRGDRWLQLISPPAPPRKLHHRRPHAGPRDSHGSEPEWVDPHLWLDPVVVRDDLVPRIGAALARAQPERAEEFGRGADAAARQIDALHAELIELLAPVTGQPFIAFHGSWGGFAQRYGLRQVGVIERGPGREPSARWMFRLIATARTEGVRVVLVEPQFGPRVADAVASGFGGRTVLVDPLGGRGTAMGDTYLTLMRRNAQVFRDALAVP